MEVTLGNDDEDMLGGAGLGKSVGFTLGDDGMTIVEQIF